MKSNNMMGWMLAEAMIVIVSIATLAGVCLLADYQPRSQREKLQADFEALIGETNSLNGENEKLKSDMAQSAKNLADQSASWARERAENTRKQKQEKLIRQKLLGIQGNMEHTIFLVDISGSILNQPKEGQYRANWGGDGTAWGYVKNQVEAWIQGLPVKRFRVIAFNEQLSHFPVDSRWASQPEDNQNVTHFLESLKPDGLTLTETALREAARLQPTSIVLITDGAPTAKGHQRFDAAQVQRIKEFVASDEFEIPITVVAVNDYFDPQFGEFLQTIAATSGGCFIGL
jgi:Mg-chelatase subunit ChlD